MAAVLVTWECQSAADICCTATLTLREIVLPPEEVTVADLDLTYSKLSGVVAHVQHGSVSQSHG